MRGTRAKNLRRLAKLMVPPEAVAATCYAERKGTRRLKQVPGLITGPDGKPVSIMHQVETFTAQLHNTCARFYSQRLKRYHVKHGAYV